MENRNEYVQEIDLRNLLFTVLYKWRPIILIAVLLGLLFGGVKLGKNIIGLQDQEKRAEAQQDYEDKLSLYENNKITYEREIENIALKIETFNEYMNHSELMQISPYSKPVATADLYIKTDYEIMPGMAFQNIDYTDTIVKAYAIAISQGELLDGIDKYVEVLDDTYLTELVTGDADYNNNMVHIEVVYSDLDIAEKMLTTVLNNIEKRVRDTSTKIGPHQIEVTNRGTELEVDTSLVKLQSDNANTQASLQKVLTEKKEALKTLKEPQFTAFSKMTALKSAIKYGILGGILGAAASVFFICVAFLMSDKVVSEKEVRNRYNIKLLGVFSVKHKKRFLSGIDHWLDRMSGAGCIIEKDAVLQRICTNIENYAESDRKLMVVGTAGESEVQNISQYLKENLAEKNIIYGGNLNTNISALQELPSCDGIILVEKRGDSHHASIQNEIEAARNLNKKIVGYILL